MSPLLLLESDLPEPLTNRTRFLKPGATTAQLVRANLLNHKAWFTLNTLNNGGTITQENGVTVLKTPDEMVLAFPNLRGGEIGATLDGLLKRCFREKPGRVACWSISPPQPRDLGARLAARGFEWGWRPHWMALDLHHLSVDFPLPDSLHVEVDKTGDWDVQNLPYYDARTDSAFRRLFAQRPRRVWRFGAWLDGELVGQTVLHVTTGAFGVGGIYNVGVIPSARNRGVGRAISLAACQYAKALGCHYATLNAATHIYDALGFVSCGYGQTWWLHSKTLYSSPPTRTQILFAEAIGRSDFPTLRGMVGHGLAPNLDAPLPNGMTPMELAIRGNQPRTAIWLQQHGATLDVIHALDLGLRDRIPQMLSNNPSLANRRFGNRQMTPAHEAVLRNDLELLQWLLEVPHLDLTLPDTEFKADALGWANHFNCTEMISLIKAKRGE